MNFARTLLLLTCLFTCLRAEDTDWAPLFTRLQANTPLLSTFDEARHYPFRLVPVKLTGELRFDSVHGLSLHYLTPEVMTLIVDKNGLLMRDNHGRERTAPPDHRAQGTANALLQLMGFNLTELEKTFRLEGNPAGDPWTLRLTPIDPELTESLGIITVTGHDDRVATIVMEKSPDRHIDITVTTATPHAVFSVEDLKRYFR